ncbi:hypothetical protein [Streptomyces milbemycinicus]|uniref:Secreted protein n=1 Tax=Streptomyces milbemycinicus TaxID=476552 RepID=A0ABW8LQX2_9ACTN
MHLTSGNKALAAIAVGIAALSVSANSAAAAPANSAAAPVAWSATHGSATASGTRWTERVDIHTDLVVQGELRNTGTECFSVWVQWIHDWVVTPYTKQATQCGGGVSPVNVRLSPYGLTTSGQMKVCRGTADTADCGEAISLTHWPINN